MDQEFLLDSQITAGEHVVLSFESKGFPVSVAFWLREFDTEKWYLYIASDRVADEQPEAYEAIISIFADDVLLRSKMDVFRIRLIDLEDDRAKIASRIILTNANTHSHYVNSFTHQLGGSIAYFYPPLNKADLISNVHSPA